MPPIVGGGKKRFAGLIFEPRHQELGQWTEIAVRVAYEIVII
jgi:hypothetical protein